MVKQLSDRQKQLNKEYYKSYWPAYYRKNKLRIDSMNLENQMRKRKVFVELVYGILGKRCSNPDCLVPGGCTDIRCLQIDHINGDGYKYISNNTAQYKFFTENPDRIRSDLQILCANCNWIKRVTNGEYKKSLKPVIKELFY